MFQYGRLLLACFLSTVMFVACTKPQDKWPSSEWSLEYEQDIAARLERISPDAVPIFQEATRALHGHDLRAAKQGYEQVLTMAPTFADAERRLSYVELALGQTTQAVDHARMADTLDSSPYNQTAYARALLAKGPPDARKAVRYALPAAMALSDSEEAQEILVVAGLNAGDMGAALRGSKALLRIAPQAPYAHYYAGLVAAARENYVRAEQELEQARALGMPAAQVQSLLDDGITEGARIQRSAQTRRTMVLSVLGGWLGGLLVFYTVGMILSRVSLAAVQRLYSTGRATITPAERRVRALYRGAVTVVTVYFYISIPLSLLTVVGGIIYTGYLTFAHQVFPVLPIVLMVFLGSIAAGIVRSLRRIIQTDEQQRQLAHEEAPALWRLIEEVAQRLGVEPVETIRISPGAEIGITNHTILDRWHSIAGKRSLILGLGALPGMSQNHLQVILAHEYGHFVHHDSQCSPLIWKTRDTIRMMVDEFRKKGLDHIRNPMYVFLSFYWPIMNNITAGLSRLQEVLADRYAATTYGAQQFRGGLEFIIRQQIIFRWQVEHEIDMVHLTHGRMRNLYTLPPIDRPDDREKVAMWLDREMSRTTGRYEGHPSPRERFALLERLPDVDPPQSVLGTVWDLFTNPEQLQMEMTAEVQSRIS